jgi:Domain of unknown function (DUF4437)
MRARVALLAVILLFSAAVSVTIRGDVPGGFVQHKDDVAIYAPGDIKWKEAPPSLPKGAMIAVLEGDPSKEGPFVFRAKLPDGYRVMPHTHDKAERVTIIAGTFYIGMGDKFDATRGTAMAAGSYGQWPADMKHFAWVKGETILQIHGTGPWSIKYVNPEDDPRNQKK